MDVADLVAGMIGRPYGIRHFHFNEVIHDSTTHVTSSTAQRLVRIRLFGGSEKKRLPGDSAFEFLSRTLELGESNSTNPICAAEAGQSMTQRPNLLLNRPKPMDAWNV